MVAVIRTRLEIRDMAYGDPQEVHGCECVKCGAWQADSWEDVDNFGWCHECAELADTDGDDDSTDWFDVACGIVG